VAGAAPLGEADVEAARLEAALAKQAHGVVGVDAVGAAAVGDNVPPARQGLRDALECGQRSRDRAGNVTGAVFGLGADVEHNDLAAAEPFLQLGRGQLLDPVALSQVVACEPV
jgi:hypothetical protein